MNAILSRRTLLRTIAAIITAVALASPGAVQAQTNYAWTGGAGTATWATATNWSVVSGAGVTFPGVGDTATFNAAAGTGGTTISTGTISLLTLVFDTVNAAAYTIGGATAGTGQITFADGTTNIVTRNSTVTASQIINANIILGTAIASTSTITNSSTSGTLTIAGNITGGTGGTGVAKTLTIAGAGATTLSGTLGKGGASGLIINNTATGTLKLSGTSTVQSLLITQTGATVDLTGGNLSLSNSGTTILTASNNATITGGTITLTSGASGNYGDFGATAGTLTVNSIIASSAGIGVDYIGAGAVTLGGANTYTGNSDIFCTVSVATVGNSAAGGGISANLGVGASILFGSGGGASKLIYTGTGEVSNKTLNFSATTGGITLDMSGTGTLQFSSAAAINAGAGIKTVTLQGSTAGIGRIDGIIQDNTSTNKTSLTKNGTGTWILAGANTYTGATTLTQGTLQFNAVNTGVSAVTLSGTATNNATLSGTGTVPGTVTLSTGTAYTGAAINPGSVGGVGTLTLSNATGFTANAFSRLNFDLNTSQATGGASNDLISSTGGVPTLFSGTGTTQVNVNALSSLTLGAYTIINGYPAPSPTRPWLALSRAMPPKRSSAS